MLEIDLSAAKQYLQAFASIDDAKTGRITYSSFVKIFASKDTEELRTLFSVLDIRDRGSLNFAEFLTGARSCCWWCLWEFCGAMGGGGGLQPVKWL